MRCSEAVVRRSPLLIALSVSFVVAQPAAFAAPPADGEHTSNKPQPTNRLATETSPYLLLHAHNPVDWRPWGPEALQAAKDANKPIFLSIGYSSCYWCHVMEREVFENEEIAAYLNEHFVCIKVDREERPDIDDQYMLALQLYFQAIGSPQGGGWPMSMFLTPDAKPFAGGTYFPAEDKPGQPGFRTVAEQVHTLWTTREADLRNNAEFLASAVARHSVPGLALETVELERSLVQGAIDAVMAGYDPEHGGFGYDPAAPEGPKFPSVPRLMLLQQRMATVAAVEVDREEAAMNHTLTRMAMGGIRDHLGGGFHRYSVDREWRVPHFEKMLYDQALLAETYLAASVLTDNTLYRDVAYEILDFVLREMTSPDGGFYSALDAETDGIEGQYYVWSRDEIELLLGPDDAEVFAAAYGLNEESRFEHGSVLYLPRSLDETAQQLGVPGDVLQRRLAAMRATLLAVRRRRPALLRDEKILASWNGLMIRPLAFAAQLAQAGNDDSAASQAYAAAAERAARFVLDRMRDDQGRLLHSYAGGRAGIAPYLDDYAYFVSGLLALSTATGNAEYEETARSLLTQQIDMFWDERGHGFFYTADDHEPLLARVKDANDSVLPSANAVSIANLTTLAGESDDFAHRAEQTLRVFAPALKASPAALPVLAAELDQFLDQPNGPGTLTITVEPDADSDEAALALAPTDELIPTAEPADDEAKKHDKLSAAAYLSLDKVPAGGECHVAVVLNIKDGWHINANPAQPKYLIPTELTARLPADFSLADVKYPAGHEFAQQGSDEPLLVYEGRVVLYGKLKAPASAAGKTAAAEITVRYQACNDQMCLRPMKLLLKGAFAVAAQGEKPQAINQSLFKPKRPSPQ